MPTPRSLTYPRTHAAREAEARLMEAQIRVVIVDDIPETREHLSKLLGFETDIEVVGTAASGEEALIVAAELMPDVVLMDINMPGLDGIATTEQLSATVPSASVVMMSVQGEADYLRRSMLAGAREFLVKPFSSDELATSIRQVNQRERKKPQLSVVPAASGIPDAERVGKIVTVFSPKGGVGRTTIAVNLAVAAQTELGKRVALVDASFQFGDVGVLLNLNPRSKSIADLVPEMAAGEPESLDSVLTTHSSGVRVLLAPPSPETAELIKTAYLTKVLERLRSDYDLVIVDSWPWFNETTLNLLDISDEILALLTLEITNIKDMRLFLEVAGQLGYSDEKIRLVLNRADSAYGIRVADVEQSLGRKIDRTITSDGRAVVYALNRGVPFFTAARQSLVSQDLLALAKLVCGDLASEEIVEPRASQPRKKMFAWR
ncbi:response regulator [soil metagenome]